jgi:putative membrane protein
MSARHDSSPFHSTRRRRLVAVAAVLGATTLLTCSPALAAGSGSGVDVTNTETVQVYTDASGKVDTSRVYEQLTLTGKGKVDLENPVSTKGVRNLDGFGGVDTDKGTQHVDTTVDGEKQLRSVADYTGKSPLTIKVAYELDGKKIDPADIVGRSGKLQVTYTVQNVSAVTQDVSFDDGKGGTITKSVDVPIPMVGSLTTVAPSSFSNVASDQANMAGDGKGGTKLSFTMTLIPPIGSDTAIFGYTADIVDGVVPRADMSALPVDPLQSPSFKTAATSYQGGAETGVELTGGAVEIDSNLLKLRDGAGDLLAGLIQLRDGADQLSQGLTDDAAPGANKLADGAGTLNDGLAKLDDGGKQLAAGTGTLKAGANDLNDGASQLDDGAGKLAGGSKDLAAGTDKALDGSKDLTSGLKKISDGLGQLGDKNAGLPAAASGIDKLKAGVDALSAGLGDVSQPKSIIGGLTALASGLGDAQTGAGTIAGGLEQLRGAQGLAAAKGGVDQVQSGLGASVSDGGSLDKLINGLASLTNNAGCRQDQVCAGTVAQLKAGAETSKSDLTAANNGLKQVSGGLGQAIGGLDTQLIPGAKQLASKLGDAKAGANDLTAGAKAAKSGAVQIRGGLDDLAKGVTSAVNGVLQLGTGATSAYNGSSTLSNGLGQLDDGAGKLAAGAGDLSDGTGKLRAGTTKLADGSTELADGAGKLSTGLGTAKGGSQQIADGAETLADGLGDAATGSTKIADGLDTATDGAPKLVDGAQQLSTDGTQKLVDAGESTAQNYGEMYAVLAAGADRANTEDMAFGAPEGAAGLTAYSFIIQGEDGDADRNLTRGLAGLALLAAGVGVVALRRRLG